MQTKRAKSAEKQVKPGRISTVLATLGREIAQGIIPPGAVLPPEHELETRLGVGRGVVREAIKTLSGKGLVSVRPRHGTRVLPRSDWSLLDRDVLNWLVGHERPDRELLLYVQEVRSIIEPAAAALAATRATEKDRQRINAALEAMQNSNSQASATAADKAFHLAILDATHNPVLQGFRGAIDTILSAVFMVAVDKVDGWFDGNLHNHAITARAIDEGNAKKARHAMEQVLGFTEARLSSLRIRSGSRNGRTTSPRHRGQGR
ncbi:MAG: FadR family transcriptional regulator [Hyphomicrobiales bacterium]|nr:MAG: FadR family transcriptional regulator [Hyphomicrobiales bacterium]